MAAALAGCVPKEEQQKPAEQPQPKEEFKYLVDEFADLRIMRYQIPEWDQLTLQQKSYIYYLGEAAKCGRDILADQNFKYNLVVRKTIEAVLNSYQGDPRALTSRTLWSMPSVCSSATASITTMQRTSSSPRSASPISLT